MKNFSFKRKMTINGEEINDLVKFNSLIDSIFVNGELPINNSIFTLETENYKYKLEVEYNVVISESLYSLNPTKVVFLKTSNGNYVNLYIPYGFTDPMLSSKNIGKIRFTKRNEVEDALKIFINLKEWRFLCC